MSVKNNLEAVRDTLVATPPVSRAGFFEAMAAMDLSAGLADVDVHSLDQLSAFLDASAVLLYHFSVGWEAGYRIFQEARCRRVINYHNINRWLLVLCCKKRIEWQHL